MLAFLCGSGLQACRFESQPLFEPIRRGGRDAGVLSMNSVDPADADAIGDDDAAARGAATVTGVGDGGADGNTPVTCTPGDVMRCVGGAALTCNADGSAFAPVDCGAVGCDAMGMRCNACRPGQHSCRGSTLVSCGADGKVEREEVCAAGCREGPGGQATCAVCTPGSSSCAGDDDLMRCDADAQWRMEACADGCDQDIQQCSGGHVVPSNLPRDACTADVEGDRKFEDESVIDTDSDCTRVVTQTEGAPELCVLRASKIEIKKGSTVRVSGSRALALLAVRSLIIEGTLSVSAARATPGPGSMRTGSGAGRTGVGRLPGGTPAQQLSELPANAGGGGGGHATRGAAGGTAPGQCGPMVACSMPGDGGDAYGNDVLVPLVGGAPGGRNSASEFSSRRTDPGGGGGAVELVACEELELGEEAIVEAGGGGGAGGGPGQMQSVSDTPGAGAGGGSGGAILIQTRVLRVHAGALLVANGGGGGGGATRKGAPGAGEQAGANGQDGQRSRTAAAGGKAAGDSFPGGAGGAIESPAPGGAARLPMQAAGGGGGAAGRIRIETAGGQLTLSDLIVSPNVTTGRVGYEP
jgi:hypothetical protein